MILPLPGESKIKIPEYKNLKTKKISSTTKVLLKPFSLLSRKTGWTFYFQIYHLNHKSSSLIFMYLHFGRDFNKLSSGTKKITTNSLKLKKK